MTKSKRGLQKDTAPEAMLVPVFKKIIEQSKIEPKLIDDVCVGNCLQGGAGATTARMAMFVAGWPHDPSVSSVNRQCSSGLTAIANIANSIRTGQIDIGVGAGNESMTIYTMEGTINADHMDPEIFENENARNCMMAMGITSENVAEEYGISRETQDKFAVESVAKAAHA